MSHWPPSAMNREHCSPTLVLVTNEFEWNFYGRLSPFGMPQYEIPSFLTMWVSSCDAKLMYVAVVVKWTYPDEVSSFW